MGRIDSIGIGKPARQPRGQRSPIRRFLSGEAGAVTVDFVVLTSAIVVTAVVILIAVGEGVTTAGDKTAKCLTIQSKIYSRDIPYEKQLKRIKRRCGRL